MPWVSPSLKDYFSKATLVGCPPGSSFRFVENQPFLFSENDLFWACALGVKYTLPALWLAAFSKPLRKPSRRERDCVPSHTPPRDSGAVCACTADRARHPWAASPGGLAMGNSVGDGQKWAVAWCSDQEGRSGLRTAVAVPTGFCRCDRARPQRSGIPHACCWKCLLRIFWNFFYGLCFIPLST